MTTPGPGHRDKDPNVPIPRSSSSRDVSTQTSPLSLSLSTVTCAELVPLLTPVQINREITHLRIIQPLPQTNLTARKNVVLYALLKSLVGEGDQEDIIENIDTNRKMDTLVKSLNFNCNSSASSFVNSTLDKNLKNVILSDMKTSLDNSDRKCAEIKRICSMKQNKSHEVNKIPGSSSGESEHYPSYSSSSPRMSPSMSDCSDLLPASSTASQELASSSPDKENAHKDDPQLTKLQTSHPRVRRASGLNKIKRGPAPKVRVDPGSLKDTSSDSDHSASPCKISPRADPRRISPRVSPRANERHISPRADSRHVSARANERHISSRADTRHLLSNTLSPLLDRSNGDTTSGSEYPSCASSFISEVNTDDLFSSLESEEYLPDHYNPDRSANLALNLHSHDNHTAQSNFQFGFVSHSRPYAPLPGSQRASPEKSHVTAEKSHGKVDHTYSESSGHSTLVPASLGSQGSTGVLSPRSSVSLYSVCKDLVYIFYTFSKFYVDFIISFVATLSIVFFLYN